MRTSRVVSVVFIPNASFGVASSVEIFYDNYVLNTKYFCTLKVIKSFILETFKANVKVENVSQFERSLMKFE